MSENKTASKFVSYLASDLLTSGNIMLVAAVGVVGLLGLSGGFEAAEPAGMTKLSAVSASGQTVETTPYTVVVGQSRVVDGRIEVPLSITLNSSHPFRGSWDLSRAFQLKDSAGHPVFTRETDIFPVTVLTISPGVQTDIIASWPDSPGAKVLEINSLTWRKSSLDGSMQWLDATPVAKVQLR